jgi:hypothetical protein
MLVTAGSVLALYLRNLQMTCSRLRSTVVGPRREAGSGTQTQIRDAKAYVRRARDRALKRRRSLVPMWDEVPSINDFASYELLENITHRAGMFYISSIK